MSLRPAWAAYQDLIPENPNKQKPVKPKYIEKLAGLTSEGGVDRHILVCIRGINIQCLGYFFPVLVYGERLV